MNARNKFFVVLGVLVVIATLYYFISTERSDDMVLIGTVDANQVIVSAKISGRIQRLLVDEGTQVKAGDLVAELDTAELLAQKNAAEATWAALRSQVSGSRSTEEATKGTTSSDVVNARARLQVANAQLDEAQADLERQRLDTDRTVALADQGIAAQADRDHAVAALKAAQAHVESLVKQVQSADADLRSAQARIHQASAAQSTVASTRAQMLSAQAQLVETDTRLGYAKVYAPVSGIVSVRAAREGEVINPGTPIVTIVDMNDTWVRAAIPETYGTKIAIGETLPVQLPSGEKVSGKVIFKGVEADFATQRDVSRRKRDIKTVALKVAVDNSQHKLVPGLTAEVLVPPAVLNRPISEPFQPALNTGSPGSTMGEKK